MPSIPFVTAIQNVAADLTTAELADLTAYGTGSNPDRADLALFLVLYKRDALLNDTAISVSNTNPTTVSSWSFNLSINDGWYVGILFGFPIWASGAFDADECVYHDTVYYKANTTTSEEPGTGSDWDVITDILSEVLNLANSGVYITQTNNFSTDRSEAGKLGDELADLGQNIISGKCKNWEDAASVLFPAGLIESAWVNFRRGDNVKAQKTIDFVQARYAA